MSASHEPYADWWASAAPPPAANARTTCYRSTDAEQATDRLSRDCAARGPKAGPGQDPDTVRDHLGPRIQGGHGRQLEHCFSWTTVVRSSGCRRYRSVQVVPRGSAYPAIQDGPA